jgi:2-oxoglutarate ferredoxin oxidoreductase subunit beta
MVARTVDVFPAHLKETLIQVAAHKGSAFVEILQNCNVFNDGAFQHLTEKAVRDDKTIGLEHDKPLIFGKDMNKGIRLRGTRLEVVEFTPGNPPADLLVHEEEDVDATVAYILSRMAPPDFPFPIGIFRRVTMPTLDGAIHGQIAEVMKRGTGDLEKLVRGPETWTVK